MSYLAIGAVTKAVIELLSKKLNKPPLLAGTFRVTSLPPDDDRVSGDTGVNLFLYRVTENQFLKNTPWVGDKANPNGSPRPPLALTLNYILTGYAKQVAGAFQDDVTAHQLLGNAMAILHDYPVLNDIHDSDFDSDLDTQFALELRQSFDKVKLSLLPISIDDFSKIWTGFSKAYRLSVAYEVSLAQIAPVVPSSLPAPVASQRSVRAATIGPPAISAINPPSGPSGAQIELIGERFTIAGRDTTVNAGGVTLAPSDLDSIASNRITFTMPPDVSGGPRVPITVTCGAGESAPVFYPMAPWISGLRPLRGMTGIPLEIPLVVPSGAAASVAINGVAAASTVDAAARVVRAVVPLTIATNGPAPVVVTLNDGTPKTSNTLLYEVMPSISSFGRNDALAPPKTTITVTGERLRGRDVILRYGKLLARVGDVTDPVKFPNADTTITFQFDRVLDPNGTVSLMIDGRQSNTLPSSISAIDPALGSAPDVVTITGQGLAGRKVTVKFGATALPDIAQPYGTRFQVQVPPGLTAGPTTVNVVVDAADAGTVPFVVTP